MKEIYIGVDLGCTGCKAIAIDGEARVQCTESIRYDDSILCTGIGCYDQDPQVLLDAATECIRKLVERVGKESHVAALGFTGQMHGLVALDANLKPLRPIISCLDFRNEEENAEIYAAVGGEEGLLNYTNNRMVASCTGGKIKWMKNHEREIYERIYKIVNPKDYVRTAMSGAVVTDESDAGGFGIYDVENRCWNRELLAKIGIEESVLPEVRGSAQVVGHVTEEYAGKLGIGTDAAVVAGAGDAIMQAVSAGAVKDGTYSFIMGSGGSMAVSLGECAYNDGGKLQIYPSAVPNQWVAYVGCTAYGTAVAWLREALYKEESKAGVAQAFERMEAEAREIEAGSKGLLFYPTLLGQRNPVEDPFAKGVMVGLTPAHTKAHMYRALLEGLAFGTREVYRSIERVSAPVRRLNVSGGCSASELWCQIMADVFGVPVHRLAAYSACGALGAAKLARGGATGMADAAALRGSFEDSEFDRVFQPNANLRGVYDDLFAIYTRVYPAMRDTFNGLRQF